MILIAVSPGGAAMVRAAEGTGLWLPAVLGLLLLAASVWAQPQPMPKEPEKKEPLTLEELTRRVIELEATNRRLTERLDGANRNNGQSGDSSAISGTPEQLQNQENRPFYEINDSPVPDYTEERFFPRSVPQVPSPGAKNPERLPLNVSFGPGFLFQSTKSDFSLQIHYESQIEYREWRKGDQIPANDGFFLPRQRFFFNGTITKPLEYEISLNRGLGRCEHSECVPELSRQR